MARRRGLKIGEAVLYLTRNFRSTKVGKKPTFFVTRRRNASVYSHFQGMQLRYNQAKAWVERLLEHYTVVREQVAYSDTPNSDMPNASSSETLEVYLVHFVFRNNNGRDILELYVDTDRGITVGECAKLSRHILEMMESSPDAAELFSDNFRLEVSSPDVSKPIRVPRQYVKNIGRTLRVRFLDELDEERTVEGRLKTAELHSDEKFIELTAQRKKKVDKTSDAPTVKIPLDRIREAVVQVEF